MTMTTEPTPTESVGKGVSNIFEGFTFFTQLWRQLPPAELTREQQIRKFLQEHGCNCGGHCGSCQHLIRDIFGD